MIVTQQMSYIADAAAQRYGMLIDGWKTIYARALEMQDFGTPRQLIRVVVEARDMARRHLNAEIGQIHEDFLLVAQIALDATHRELRVTVADDHSEALAAHLSAFDAYLESELELQVERDVAFLMKTLRDTHLTVSIAARASGLPLRTALMQHRIGTSTELRFSFHDRRASKWPSTRYIRSLWRQSLLSVYNDTVLMTLSDHGIDRAIIRHDDPSADVHGTMVTMSPSADIPTYGEIRDHAFHPNANAVLARAV